MSENPTTDRIRAWATKWTDDGGYKELHGIAAEIDVELREAHERIELLEAELMAARFIVGRVAEKFVATGGTTRPSEPLRRRIRILKQHAFYSFDELVRLLAEDADKIDRGSVPRAEIERRAKRWLGRFEGGERFSQPIVAPVGSGCDHHPTVAIPAHEHLRELRQVVPGH